MPDTAGSRETTGDPRFLFLSELLGRPVTAPDGTRVGRLSDLVAATGEPYPPIESLVMKGATGLRQVPWSAVERLGEEAIVLRAGAEALPLPAAPGPDRMPLAGDLLDRQIVDVHDAKVVRVNDLHFLEVKGQLRIAHVDVGFRGLVRRLGWQPFVDGLVSAVSKEARYLKSDQLVGWKLVQPLDRSAGKLRLEVARRMLATIHPADLAEILEDLDRDKRTVLLQRLDVETAADALEEVEPELSAQLLEEVPAAHAADILEEMQPDEAADVLSELAGDSRDEMLAAMERPDAKEVQELLAYPPDSAGGLMTPDRLQLGPAQTVADAIAELRRRADELPFVYEIFVADEKGRLVGVCTLRDLLLNEASTALAALMREPAATVRLDARLRDVAGLASKYNLVTVPVVDPQGVVNGMVTVDDILAGVLDAR
jgi:CBS domain-containing protein/sporulation protein YlmC with PRC-barrel domain